MKRTLLFLLVLAISACGGSDGAGPNQPPVTNVSPGGIWGGLDSSGHDIVALITEAGSFQLVTLLGFTFVDGTTSADCTFSGTVVERQTISASVDCTTTAGLRTQVTATLAYEALYDRDSSLALVSGNYQGMQEVLNIAADGAMFSQDAGNGCVVNRQITIINAAYNAYDVEFTYSNCLGEAAALNGSTFAGLALLDNTVAPEELGIAVTGDVIGVHVSLVLISERI